MDKVYQQTRVYPLVYGARVYSRAEISHDDSGSAGESESTVVSRSDVDTGSGVDTAAVVIVVERSDTDATPKGTDTAAVVLSVDHSDNDVGMGDYDQGVVYSRTDTDNGTADESETTVYGPIDIDSGTSSESETTAASHSDAFVGSGSDVEPAAGYDNLFPPFEEWEITGNDGSYIDDEGRLHLIRNDTAIGWARVDRLRYVRVFADFFPIGPSDFYYSNSGRHWSIDYRDENLDPVEIPGGWTSNGNASSLEPDVWHERESWQRDLGEDNVTWVRLRINTSVRTPDETIIDRPQCVASDSSIPASFPWVPHYLADVEPSFVDVDDAFGSESEVLPNVTYSDSDVGIGDYDQAVVYSRTDTESGVGSESEGTVYAPTDADIGTGEDVELQTYSPTDTDALSGAEAELWAAALTPTDEGAGTDSEVYSTTFVDTDTGSSDESEAPPAAAMVEGDVGFGDYDEAVVYYVDGSDEAVASESQTPEYSPVDNDELVGTDSETQEYSPTDSDSLIGSDTEVWAASFTPTEDGIGSESEQLPTASITDQEDAGSDESEQVDISFNLVDDDAGIGTDEEVFSVSIEDSDESVTAEFELTHITLAESDVGFGDYDTAVTYERVDTDAGTAAEDEDVYYTELNLFDDDQAYGEEHFGTLYVVTPTYEDEATATFDEDWFEVLLDLKVTVSGPVVKHDVSEPVVDRW